MEDTDFWNAIAIASSHRRQLEDLFEAVDQLSIDDKAALAKHLMSSFGINVVLRSDSSSNSIISQINMMDNAALGELLRAIATRVTHKT